MPALMRTAFTGTITFLGFVPKDGDGLASQSLDRADVTLDGITGERHGGLTRASCSRVTSQYERGTEIRNVRQLSILSTEEMDKIADKMGLEALDPRLLGVSMVIKGIPDFTHVPPSSRLQAASGATFVIDMENRPCIYPGREIETDHTGYGKLFKPAAKHLRGVTAWVELGGAVAVGDSVTLHIPDQPVWPHLDAARG